MRYTPFKYCGILFLPPLALLGLLTLANCGGGSGGGGGGSGSASSEYPESLSFEADTWTGADGRDVALVLENRVEFDHDGNDATPPMFYYLMEPPSSAHHDDLDALLNGGEDTVDTDREGGEAHDDGDAPDDDARSAVISTTDADSGETITWTLILPTVAEFRALRAGHENQVPAGVKGQAPISWNQFLEDAPFETWTSTLTMACDPDSHKVYFFNLPGDITRDFVDTSSSGKVVFQLVGMRTE